MEERQAEKQHPASPASDGDRKDGKQERNAVSLRDQKGERDEKGESSLIRRNPKASRGFVPRYYSRSFATKNGVGAGICYMRDEEVLIRDNIGLTPKANIFQAALKAIELACETLYTHPI